MNQPLSLRKLSNPWFFIPVLALLSTSLGCLWFFHHFEKKVIEIHQGGSPAAQRNPLLAAEKYLLATGQSADSLEGIEMLTDLPSSRDAILIRHLPGGLGKSALDTLLGWVEAGGHLLIIPNPTASEHPGSTNIFDRLGTRLQPAQEENDCGCPPPKQEETDTEEMSETPSQDSELPSVKATDDESLPDSFPDDSYRPSHNIITLHLDDTPLKLESFSPVLLEDTSQAAVFRIDGSYHIDYEEENLKQKDLLFEVEEEGAWLLQYHIGLGKVTVLSEMTLLFNDHIGNYDHAFFLSWLVEGADNVWLLYATNVDSLLSILWGASPFLWISLGVFTLLILWRLQKRSGSLLQPKGEEHHNILTHINASGLYNWRTDKLASMVEFNRENMLHWWVSKKLSHQQNRNIHDIDITPLAEKIGVSEEEIHDAFQKHVTNETELMKTSRALQKIQTLVQGGEYIQDDS